MIFAFFFFPISFVLSSAGSFQFYHQSIICIAFFRFAWFVRFYSHTDTCVYLFAGKQKHTPEHIHDATIHRQKRRPLLPCVFGPRPCVGTKEFVFFLSFVGSFVRSFVSFLNRSQLKCKPHTTQQRQQKNGTACERRKMQRLRWNVKPKPAFSVCRFKFLSVRTTGERVHLLSNHLEFHHMN